MSVSRCQIIRVKIAGDQIGFYPEEVPPWIKAGFGPDETLEWKYGKKEYHDDGEGYSRTVFSLEWAREWRGAGFSSEEARRAGRMRRRSRPTCQGRAPARRNRVAGGRASW